MTVLDRISVRPNNDGGHRIVVRSERPPVPPTARREINPNPYEHPYERYNEPHIREGSAPHNVGRLRESGHVYGAHPVDEPDTPLRLIDYRPSFPYPIDDEPAVRSGPARLPQHSGGYYDSHDEPAVRDGPARHLQHSGGYYDSHNEPAVRGGPARQPQGSGYYHGLYDEPVVRSGPVRHHQHSGSYFDPYEDPAVRDGLISPPQYTYNYLPDSEPEVLDGRVRRPQRSGNYYDPHDEPAVRSGSRGPPKPFSGKRYDSLDQPAVRSGRLQHSGYYDDPYEDSAVRDDLVSPQQHTYGRRQGRHEPEILDGAVRRPQPQSPYNSLPAGAQPVLLPDGTTVWVPRPPAPNAGPTVPGVGGHVSYDPALRGATEQYRMQGRQQIDPRRTVRSGAWGGYGG